MKICETCGKEFQENCDCEVNCEACASEYCEAEIERTRIIGEEITRLKKELKNAQAEIEKMRKLLGRCEKALEKAGYLTLLSDIRKEIEHD